MAESATFALKAGVWFRRGRLFMVSPDSLGTACPLSGRNSTYRPVQIFETSSDDLRIADNKNDALRLASTFTVRASGKGMEELTARFRYEPDKFPKLRKLWR